MKLDLKQIQTPRFNASGRHNEKRAQLARDVGLYDVIFGPERCALSTLSICTELERGAWKDKGNGLTTCTGTAGRLWLKSLAGTNCFFLRVEDDQQNFSNVKHNTAMASWMHQCTGLSALRLRIYPTRPATSSQADHLKPVAGSRGAGRDNSINATASTRRETKRQASCTHPLECTLA